MLSPIEQWEVQSYRAPHSILPPYPTFFEEKLVTSNISYKTIYAFGPILEENKVVSFLPNIVSGLMGFFLGDGFVASSKVAFLLFFM